MEPDVLYTDNHLLIIAKPAGMLAQSDETGDLDVVSWGKAYLKRRFDKPGNVFLGLVHRLDRPVSGIMVLGRTSKAAARLTDQFSKHRADKRYLAIVEGRLEGTGTMEDYLVKDDRTVRVVTRGHPKGKHARLRWQSLASGEDTSLVDVRLETGRPHQIRIQLATRGHALLGDTRYGAEAPFEGRHLALHCYYLSIEHPTRREPVITTLDPPASWSGRYEQARAGLFAGLTG